MLKKIIIIFLDIFFPKYCFGCKKQGIYLCEDCKACLEISQYQYCLCKKPIIYSGKCNKCKLKKLDALYFAISYQKSLIKKLIQYFKYEPLIKELSNPLTFLVIEHFQLLENQPSFLIDKVNESCASSSRFANARVTDYILIPIPLYIKKLKWRGFNQAEEIAKELSNFLDIPSAFDCLIKNQETRPQTELNDQERKENVKGVFLIKNKEKIKNKKILLVDDVYTTGSTMEEAAEVLKKAGAKKVIGITIARG